MPVERTDDGIFIAVGRVGPKREFSIVVVDNNHEHLWMCGIGARPVETGDEF